MKTQQAFVEAIRANPDDDFPRLAYSDWLSERGDPSGELIRVQCELFQKDYDDPDFEDLLDKQSDVMKRVPQLKTANADVGYSKGMMQAVLLRSIEGISEASQFLQKHLRFTMITCLKVSPGVTLTTHTLDLILRAFDLRSCVHVDLYDTSLTGVGVQALSTTSELKQLKKLVLRGNPIGDLGAVTLFSAHWFSNLEELLLCECGISQDGLEALGKARHSELKVLDLSQNNINNQGAEYLATSQALHHLEDLKLMYNNIEDDGIKALTDSTYLINLERLSLHENSISSEGLSYFFTHAQCEKLKVLKVPQNQIGDECVDGMIKNAALPNLKVFDFSVNNEDFSENAQIQIAHSTQFGIEFLGLTLTPNAAEEFLYRCKLPNLKGFISLHYSDLPHELEDALHKKYNSPLPDYVSLD